jgi:hypothetical protein
MASLHDRGLFYAAWIPLPGIIVVFAGVLTGESRRRSRISYAGLAVFLLLVVLQTACGSSGSSTTPTPQPGTPAGTYTVAITANSGSLSHTTTVSLTVQ